ncbi:MAG TPA: adenosylmethionine decarboxylase [Longimicrobium sp.]|nr:adenosylmethionine decarboxylase [Longimicrobium sp.]
MEPNGILVGSHYLLELHGCPFAELNDPMGLEAALWVAAGAGGLAVVEVRVHAFAPHGVTALAVLRESHISVHTWPELGYAAADVFTCGRRVRPERTCTALIRHLRAAQYSVRCIPREALRNSPLVPVRPESHE